MSQERQISEAEWRVLEVLWKESPLSTAEVAERLRGGKEWAENTVRTLLDRLREKGAVRKFRSEGRLRYEPRVARKDCVQSEATSFLARVFAGKAAPLLLHFAREAKLSPAEVKELRTLLDEERPS